MTRHPLPATTAPAASTRAIARWDTLRHARTNAARRSRTATRPASAGPQDAGWTLIELLVVISLIMILTSVAMVQYHNSVLSTKEAALRSNLYLMRDAIDQYYADKNKYPESLDALVTDRYMRAIPKDPITNATDWQTVPADAEPGSTSAQAGVYEVKSSSQESALDGSHYSDW